MFSEVKFPVPWGHVAAKAWGPPQGHPVLCLHGWLDNANTFDRLIPLLPTDHRYVAMDFSGHGLSSHRPAGLPYHFLDYVSEVCRVAGALQWRRFTLMGHSMGGSVAGMFCFLYPEMVDKLILLENVGFLPAPEETEEWLKSKRMVIDTLLSLEAKQQPPKARNPEAALQRLLEVNGHLTAESGAILLQRGATVTPAGLVYNRDVRVHTSQESLAMEQYVKLLQKIQAPILTIIAQDGLLSPHKQYRRNSFVKLLWETATSVLKEHSQLVEVPGSHFVHLNEPEVVSGIISNFLTEQDTTARL
ncbi:serine hydrolase-like protein 2 isoform X2 [Dromaius novaehollandiae]|uniref:serine hydrolase-like protein 2 isoform X2 n=1 Tax=Dromaius novaehollandiae TaxID=8790 RepID=UPI00311DD280